MHASADGKLRIDGIGISLVGLGSAALEFLLDRGQIDDWFGSKLIVWATVIAGTCLTTAVFWELRHPDPVIDLKMLKVRNFAIANVFYFIFGVGLFASTTMIPQILQSLYGYRAIDAGLVLGPGALVITFLAPVGAQLVQRGIIHPRILLFGAVVVVGISFLHYSHFNLDTDYTHYALARGLQGFGYAFFFVPLTVIAYSQLTPQQNNKASSLTNFFRNWGGSVGVSLVDNHVGAQARPTPGAGGRQPDLIVGNAAECGETDRGIFAATGFFTRGCHDRSIQSLLQPADCSDQASGFYGLLLHSRSDHVGSCPVGSFDEIFQGGRRFIGRALTHCCFAHRCGLPPI